MIKAASMTAPGHLETRSYPYPKLERGAALIRMELSGICGTDKHTYLGETRQYAGSASERTTPFPIIPGHENVGIVEEIDKVGAESLEFNGERLRPGDRVTMCPDVICGRCWYCRNTFGYPFCEKIRGYGTGFSCAESPHLFGGWAEYLYAMPGVFLYKVPEGIGPEIAVLTELFAVSYAVDRAKEAYSLANEGFSAGDTVVVQGIGPMGLFCLIKARILGAGEIIAIDRSDYRLEMARTFSADHTLNLDETQLRGKITPRTKAIVALHYAGVACDMDAIQEVSRETGVPIVEDNALGLFGSYRGRLLGSFGCLAIQSFHETKNISCGEGGALLINRPDLVERAEILREKGTDRSRFFRGQVDKYTWVDLGSSYLPSELQAAFLYAQLEARERIQTRRAELCQRYRGELSDWATRSGVGLPQIPAHCEPPHHLFYLILPTPEARRALIETLAGRSILAPFHYQPLHLSAMGRRFGGQPGECPVAERVSGLLVRLPLYNGMTDAEQGEVIEAVRDFEP